MFVRWFTKDGLDYYDFCDGENIYTLKGKPNIADLKFVYGKGKETSVEDARIFWNNLISNCEYEQLIEEEQGLNNYRAFDIDSCVKHIRQYHSTANSFLLSLKQHKKIEDFKIEHFDYNSEMKVMIKIAKPLENISITIKIV